MQNFICVIWEQNLPQIFLGKQGKHQVKPLLLPTKLIYYFKLSVHLLIIRLSFHCSGYVKVGIRAPIPGRAIRTVSKGLCTPTRPYQVYCPSYTLKASYRLLPWNHFDVASNTKYFLLKIIKYFLEILTMNSESQSWDSPKREFLWRASLIGKS